MKQEELIIDWIKNHPNLSAQKIYDGLLANNLLLDVKFSLSTLKRRLSKLKENNLVSSTGKGSGLKYSISPEYQFIYEIDSKTYFEKNDREGKERFNFDLIESLKTIRIFTDEELTKLANLQLEYEQNIAQLSDEGYKLELERLSIDLTWKSSEIEGNTYSLLDTERLIKEKKTADGKTLAEASMLLNHKVAIDYLILNPDIFEILTVREIENIHFLLMKDLNVKPNIRTELISVLGTNYSPLDNEYQIREALTNMCKLVNLRENAFEKALLILILVSYIQAFMDGNKRLARIVANGILIQHKFCPISFRTVEPSDYKKAMLIFYEQNNISAFKRIFITQFEFAVSSYFRVSNS
ncbi:MAG: Fic family protein [Flavobacteriia bacterium]|nr:Fic family protein [Flavobacteriia bacterium]